MQDPDTEALSKWELEWEARCITPDPVRFGSDFLTLVCGAHGPFSGPLLTFMLVRRTQSVSDEVEDSRCHPHPGWDMRVTLG